MFVAGTFNGWNHRANPMKRESEGQWSAELDLIPGTYEYKFVADGEWCCEPGSDSLSVASAEYVANPFGTTNRKLEIS
jgi:1,4-alpha-glucan branching enzyme